MLFVAVPPALINGIVLAFIDSITFSQASSEFTFIDPFIMIGHDTEAANLTMKEASFEDSSIFEVVLAKTLHVTMDPIALID